MIKKSLFFFLLLIFNYSYSQNLTSNKSIPILLTQSSIQTVFYSGKNEQVFNEITHYSYDSSNRLVSSITKSSDKMQNLIKDSTLISYNKQGKIDLVERYITDSGSNIVKTLKYEDDQILVHTINHSTYIKGGPISTCGPGPSIENDIIIKIDKENSLFQIYNKDNDLVRTIEFTEKKDKSDCLNPYSLIGNELFWQIVMDWPEKGNPNMEARENELIECKKTSKHTDSFGINYPDKIISTFEKGRFVITTDFEYKN